jgi:hypothetical protein
MATNYECLEEIQKATVNSEEVLVVISVEKIILMFTHIFSGAINVTMICALTVNVMINANKAIYLKNLVVTR